MDSFLAAVASEYASGSIRETEDGQAVFEHLMRSFHELLEV